MAPSNTEILFELDVGDKVIGVSSFCDYPKQVVDKPTIGSWMKNEDIQRFDELSPDLILTSMYTPPSVVEWSSVNDVELV